MSEQNPWDDEPDQWAGEMCEAIRHPHLKHWCGYIILPPGHRWHGLHYDKIDEAMAIEVHGGLTYAAAHGDDWRIGFDCAHAWDMAPGHSFIGGGTYRTLEFVQKEIMKLMRAAVEAQRSAA